MPLPDPTGWVPQQVLAGIGAAPTDEPPAYIQNELARIGTPWDPSRFGWDPMSMSLIDKASGSRYSYANIADPSLGTNVITYPGLGPVDMVGGTPAGSADAYGFNGGQVTNFSGTPFTGFAGGGNTFISDDPNAIDQYQHDAQTRNLQGVAQIGALVGGGAAANALWPAASTASGGATTFPYAAGGPVTASPLASTAPGTFGQAATIAGSTTAAGVAPQVANSLSTVPKWLDYALPGINALVGGYAANQAADAESAGFDRAIAEGARQYDTTRSDLMPWLTAGQGALNQLSNPTANFSASPDYEFRRSEGMRDIGNSFSARGGAQSGNALRALSEYNSSLASGEFGNWWNRQAGLAGVGQTAGTNLGQFGANTAANAGNFLAGQGASRASGVLGKYGALANAGQDIYENYLYRRRRA